jgi:integrase
MSTLKELITFDSENAYESAYDFPLKKNFSIPKIYTAKGDLTKRWYIYFSFREPTSGKLKRITPFYSNINKFKTKEERMSVLVTYRKVLLRLLKQGYNPFKDNSVLYQELNIKKSAPDQKELSSTNSKAKIETPKMTLEEAFGFGIKRKEKLLSATTKRGYENKIKNFQKWVKENHPEIKTIDALDKKIVMSFLNDVLDKTSARNRNNFRTDLSSIIQVLVDNEIIAHNFIKKISILKSIPKRNKTYTLETQEKIFNYLEKKDPVLLLYIKFISYGLLRPIEVCRLRVKDININAKTIQFKAKNSPLKTKIIPELLWNSLPDLKVLKKEALLFTELGNRRDYFTKRFKRVVKDHFGLGTDYGLYSFRHTYITKLYRALMKGSSPFEAKSKLMLITGHSSMTALEKYLRDIDAELPADYSEMLEKTHE